MGDNDEVLVKDKNSWGHVEQLHKFYYLPNYGRHRDKNQGKWKRFVCGTIRCGNLRKLWTENGNTTLKDQKCGDM